MEITDFSLTPNTTIANGADKISANATIVNGSEYVSNEPVVFSITSGSAVFSNGESSIVVSSNPLGEVAASLVDMTAETVVIEIALHNDAAIYDSLPATFTQSDNTVDTINLLLTVDDAKADGEGGRPEPSGITDAQRSRPCFGYIRFPHTVKWCRLYQWK